MSNLLRLLAPRYCVDAVFDLTPSRLRAWGIEALMLDLDNTLVAWGKSEPPEEVLAWLEDLRRSGIPVCLVSNTLSRRLRAATVALELPAAPGRSKPSADKLRRALRILGTSPDRTAMVGDQLFTDVLAGNRLGIPTILTGPLSPYEPLRVRFVRAIERFVLRALARKGVVPVRPQV
ncbi:MAG: YqeG family HAD IIIA-type phosphatase [Armatimonadetes bacterium]|nr:YqeG family HAD IIIA-type phosphatase [Armatimonadota bacterium]